VINSFLTSRTLNKFNGQHLNNKIYLRNLFLQKVTSYYLKKRILTLTGTNYSRCINELEDHNLIGKRSCEICVVERDNEIFYQIYEQALNCPYYQKQIVRLHNCDLSDVGCYDYEFQDIDLMCTWKKGYDILAERLTRQLESNKRKPKIVRMPLYFMFSLSEWGIPLKDSYTYLKKFLKETLGCTVWGMNKIKGEFGKGIPVSNQISNWCYIKKYEIYCIEDKWGKHAIEIDLYRYRDTTNMTTCLIKYK
jgi:hypothetical protein